jgi:hypothetical protein
MCVKFSIPERLAVAHMHYLVHTNSEYVVFGNKEFSSSGNDVNCCTEPPCDAFSSRVCEECCKLVTALKID